MAGTSLQGPIGVGPALEKARRIRGLTLDEASRDTRLRVDQLMALEVEDFGALPSDAFIRGALRTYAQYLGVSPDKVLGAYARHALTPEAPRPPDGLGRIERAIAATRIRDNQRFLLAGAALLVVMLLVLGPLSPDGGTPVPASIPLTTPSEVSAATVDAVLVARRAVAVTVTVDGAEQAPPMEEGETLSFSADEQLVLSVADGKAVEVSVDGLDLGAPGAARQALDPNVHGGWHAGRDRRLGDAVSRSMRVEVIGVGTELLLGQIANTNARWIGERLSEIGADVLFHQVVGDNVERIVSVIELAATRADVGARDRRTGADRGRPDARRARARSAGASRA